MSVTGMVLMWVLFGVVYAIVSRWHMGRESDLSRVYWDKYEKK